MLEIIKQYRFYIAFIIIVALAIISNNIFAWNKTGHQLISELAYNQLTKEEQLKLDKILDLLIKDFNQQDKKEFKQQSYSLSKLAKLSSMPDTWRGIKFSDLTVNRFNILDKTITTNLADEVTNNWHYRSLLLRDSNPIASAQKTSGRLDVVTNQLILNTRQTQDLHAKAFGIVFLAHLLEDAHQPLHSFSKVLENNQHDHGGNLFCLKKKKHDQCKLNLHQYWDKAGMWLNIRLPIKAKMATIKQHYPRNKIALKNLSKANYDNPEAWLNESSSYWSFVYDTPVNQMPNSAYEAKTRSISTQRMAIAGYRLADLLKTLI